SPCFPSGRGNSHPRPCCSLPGFLGVWKNSRRKVFRLADSNNFSWLCSLDFLLSFLDFPVHHFLLDHRKDVRHHPIEEKPRRPVLGDERQDNRHHPHHHLLLAGGLSGHLARHLLLEEHGPSHQKG